MFRAILRLPLASAVLAGTLAACQGPTHITIDPKQPVLKTRHDSIQLIGHVMTNTLENAKERVEWSSEDPTIAKVDEAGHLTGVKGGRTTIVAKHGDLVAKVPVEVVLVDALRTDMGQVELSYKEGDPMKPKIEAIAYDGRVLKDRPIYWKSSNEKVCRADQTGQIWPVEQGEADITANVDEQSVTLHCVVGK